MSFTITCDKCGNKRTFTNDSRKYEDDAISVDVYVIGSYMGDAVQSIEINCDNLKCHNEVEIKY